MTLPLPIRDKSETLTQEAANAVFETAWATTRKRARNARLLIIDAKARIVYATPEALELFGARDKSDLESRLLAGEAPAARRLRRLAMTLPIGEAPQLERMAFRRGLGAASLNFTCARMATSTRGTLLVLWSPAPTARTDETPDETTRDDATRAEAPAGGAARVHAPKPSMKSRFLWSLDREGRFGEADPLLISLLGGNAPQRGETLEALRLRTGLTHGDELTRVLESRETFADSLVVWPSAVGHRQWRIRLSAAPVFDRGRDFAGHRGFGRFDGAISAPDEAAPLVLEGVSAAIGEDRAAESPDAATAHDANARDPEIDSAKTARASEVERALPPESSESASAAIASPAEEAADGVELVPASAEIRKEDGPGNLADEPTAATRADHASETAERESAVDARDDAPGAPPERTAEIYVLRQTHGTSSKIVPIRPGALDSLPLDQAQVSGEETVELSKSEREAFREIARALVGRTPIARRDAESHVPASTADAPNEPGETAPSLFQPARVRQPGEVAEAGETVAPNAWTILDRLPMGVLVVRDAQALYLNLTLLDLLGYRDFKHFQAANGLAAMFRGLDPQAMPAREHGALQIVRLDGQPLAVDGHAQAVMWGDAPATLIAFRRLCEAALGDGRPTVEEETLSRTAAADLQAMLDHATDGAVTLDSAGRIETMSAPAERLFGYAEKDIAGESVLMLLAPQSHPETTARLENLSRNDSAAVAGPIQVVGRDRAGAALSLALTLARIGPPDAPHYCALMRDMSREREAERMLTGARDAALAASATKTDFLSQVSHEIRTPLHAILGFAEVMIEERFGPIGNERYKDYIKDIHVSGKHVMSLADDLLDLSKIESRKLELAFAPVDVNSLIRECMSMMQSQAARERIIMRMSLFDRLPRVMVDERSLKQIMLNLMSNAVKFNGPGGQVIVSTAVDGSGQAVIRVRDTGVGMSESEVGIALEPFSQIRGAARKGGVGLGLPLTKALVEANGAEFSIKSRPDHGTLIEIAFPAVRAA